MNPVLPGATGTVPVPSRLTRRGLRLKRPLIRLAEWPAALPEGHIECPSGSCRGILHTTHETVRYEGGGAAQLFRVEHETRRCSVCRGRWQVVTITPESQS